MLLKNPSSKLLVFGNVFSYDVVYCFVRIWPKVPKGVFAHFVVIFIKYLLKTFELENETFSSSKLGRKPYVIYKISSLVFYVYSGGFTKASFIPDMVKNHSHF